MKKRNSTISKPRVGFWAIAIILMTSFVAQGQNNTSSFRLISPGLVAQGQSFTGTVVEDTDKGPVPLPEGSRISVMGEVVEVKKNGKVEVPTCDHTSGAFLPDASIVSIAGQPSTLRQPNIATSQINSIPFAETATPVTEIWSTSDIIAPGKILTVRGTNLTELTDEVLTSNNGSTVQLTELSSSYFESQYVVNDASFPQGEYQFSGEDMTGNIHIAPDVSLNPTFEMYGPALKHVGQKGKITIKTDGDGIITLSGGLPVIELHPNSDIATVNSDIGTTFLFDVEGGDAITIPFTAMQVGQYTVTADLHAQNELPEELLGDAVTVELHPPETSFDPVTNETTVSSSVEVVSNDGTPLSNTSVEGILSTPAGSEFVSTTTDASGIANITTTLPGHSDATNIAFHMINVTGYTILQDAANNGNGECNNPEPVQDGETDNDDMSEYADVLRTNKEVWGNYQGICGTGLMEMARNHPQAYADFLAAEQWIENWLNGMNQDNPGNSEENDSGQLDDLTDGMREIYEANKKKWGNYQGICGTALMDMARNYPDLYQEFLDNEKRIEDMLNGNNNEENNEPAIPGELDEEMKKIYRDNKRIWGNYQGICGTGLMDMAQNYPDLYKEFLENEKRIEKMLGE